MVIYTTICEENNGEAIENAVLNFWPCTRTFCDVRNRLRSRDQICIEKASG